MLRIYLLVLTLNVFAICHFLCSKVVFTSIVRDRAEIDRPASIHARSKAKVLSK
jgi:hypothetical protein